MKSHHTQAFKQFYSSLKTLSKDELYMQFQENILNINNQYKQHLSLYIEGSSTTKADIMSQFDIEWIDTLQCSSSSLFYSYCKNFSSLNESFIQHSIWNNHLYKLPQKKLEFDIRFITPEIGHGLFSRKDIKKNVFIGLYTGNLIYRWLFSLKDNSFTYSLFEAWNKLVFFGIDSLYKGNHTRFINHSVNPNCKVIPIISYNTLLLAIITTEPISAHSQLLLNYGYAYWSRSKKAAKLNH